MTRQSEVAAADVLRRLALDEDLKACVLARPEIYRVLYGAAARFVGGETLEACLGVARDTNEAGHAVTIDFMGESTRNRADAAEAAEAAGIEMMISAEGADRTDEVLCVHDRLSRRFLNVGVTIQAYLYRSGADLDGLLTRPGRVRIVKGAFDAPIDVAMRRGADLNEAYLSLVSSLIESGHPCSVATHDSEIIDAVLPEMGENNSEFEMLRGIASHQLSELRGQGIPTRVYSRG
ncbi:MAG: proline dehydrogenase [Spirochaetes bacterium]|jgi:proline dehydrogenase|nr:proline dehydrogenase [Spirochaetota bacterium]